MQRYDIAECLEAIKLEHQRLGSPVKHLLASRHTFDQIVEVSKGVLKQYDEEGAPEPWQQMIAVGYRSAQTGLKSLKRTKNNTK